MQSQKKTGGSRKIGRNKRFCEIYRNLGRRERNKALKLARHIKTHPKDKQAKRAA